jgi:hypothetical protein
VHDGVNCKNMSFKDLHVQFGASQTTFWELAWFGMDSFILNVGRDVRGRVWWDKSEEHSKNLEAQKLLLYSAVVYCSSLGRL